MAPAQIVEVADLPPEMRDQPGRESPTSWIEGLSTEADRLIVAHPGEVFDRLTREFERTLIRRALAATGGRRIEAAQLLGIGRNTISRKIQDLGMDEGRNGDEHEH
jgi:two-component system nitrogen regulation response regulator GlnG